MTQNSLRFALALALDALTDAMKQEEKFCREDKPHNHALLRKLQHAVGVADSTLALPDYVTVTSNGSLLHVDHKHDNCIHPCSSSCPTGRIKA